MRRTPAVCPVVRLLQVRHWRCRECFVDASTSLALQGEASASEIGLSV